MERNDIMKLVKEHKEKFLEHMKKFEELERKEKELNYPRIYKKNEMDSKIDKSNNEGFSPNGDRLSTIPEGEIEYSVKNTLIDSHTLSPSSEFTNNYNKNNNDNKNKNISNIKHKSNILIRNEELVGRESDDDIDKRSLENKGKLNSLENQRSSDKDYKYNDLNRSSESEGYFNKENKHNNENNIDDNSYSHDASSDYRSDINNHNDKKIEKVKEISNLKNKLNNLYKEFDSDSDVGTRSEDDDKVLKGNNQDYTSSPNNKHYTCGSKKHHTAYTYSTIAKMKNKANSNQANKKSMYSQKILKQKPYNGKFDTVKLYQSFQNEWKKLPFLQNRQRTATFKTHKPTKNEPTEEELRIKKEETLSLQKVKNVRQPLRHYIKY